MWDKFDTRCVFLGPHLNCETWVLELFTRKRIPQTTDYGHPESFFSKIPNLWAENFGGNGVFSANSSAPILVFHYFYKNLSLHIQFPNIYLGCKEFNHPVSVVCVANTTLDESALEYANFESWPMVLHFDKMNNFNTYVFLTVWYN